MKIRDALLNGPLGFGAAPLGNMFRNIPEEEAAATVDAAWRLGVRYYDTAPFYGAGLSEIRLGKELAKHKRSEYILSTKVGRLILDEVEDVSARDFGEKGDIFKYGRPNKVVYDYTADGAKKSIEDSLKRMGVDHIDFVWVHDIAQDFHGDAWVETFDTARKGAFVALSQLRDQGVIKGWGLGVNKVQPVELLLDLQEVKPDATLLAGRYSILDHELALQRVMPEAAAKGVDIVVGGPYSSGVLVGGAHFEYGPVPPAIQEKVQKIKALAQKYRIPVKAAALHFSLAHPAAAAIIPGASKPDRIKEDQTALNTKVPDDFWRELRAQGLVAPNAPLPIDKDEAMAKASSTVDLPAPPDQVWKLIGGFGSLPDWLPYIPKSELAEGGRTRRLANPDGGTIVERLMAFDEQRRSYTYHILQAPFPVTEYYSTLSVVETNGGKASRVVWSGEFTPNAGVSDAEASKIFQGIYDDGLKALARSFPN